MINLCYGSWTRTNSVVPSIFLLSLPKTNFEHREEKIDIGKKSPLPTYDLWQRHLIDIDKEGFVAIALILPLPFLHQIMRVFRPEDCY